MPVAKVVAPHGVKGEVKVKPFGDVEEVARMAAELWDEVMIGAAAYTIKRAKAHGKLVILKFDGVTTREAAEALKGEELLVKRSELPEPAGGEYYRSDLIGLTVVTVAGDELGTLENVFSTGANDVYEVTGPGGEVLIPVIEDVVKEVDLDNKKITVELPEGLLPDDGLLPDGGPVPGKS